MCSPSFMIPPIDAMITSGRLTLPPTSDGCRCKQPKREAPAGERGASLESRRRFREIGHFRSQNLSVALACTVAAKPAGRCQPKTLLADDTAPVGCTFLDLLDWLDPVVGFVDDARCELHVSREI